MDDLLWKALDIMRERGLAKCMLEDAEGHVCMNGAINTVLTGSPTVWAFLSAEASTARTMLSEVAEELFPDRTSEIAGCPASFNNHPLTTQAEVEMVMEKAAIRQDEVLSS